MTEYDTGDILTTEKQLGITFVSADESLLKMLNSKLDIVSHRLGTIRPEIQTPSRGFVKNSLSRNQEQAVNLIIEEGYARDAVSLQDSLTRIPVKESGEKMVYLPTLFKDNNLDLSLSKLPFHEACGVWAGKERVFWAREQVANRLVIAAKAVAAIDLELHIEDAFRPVGVQEGLFLRRAKMILREHPDWIEDWDKVWAETRSKTAITPLMAGHKSGAALDISLKRKSDGAYLPIGNKYPEGSAKVALTYPYVTQEEWSNRQLFTQTMEMSGLRIYPYETWHASYGDLSAGIEAFSGSATIKDYEAIYGPINGFNNLTGEIIPYEQTDYNLPFFTQEVLLDILKGSE